MPNDLAPSPIRDPQVKAVLARLHTGRKRHASGGPLGDLNASRDPFQYAEYGFSIVPEQGDLIYLLCRGLRTQRVAEFATSIGMSTIYFAAAVRDNGGGKVIGSQLVPQKLRRHVVTSPMLVLQTMPKYARATPGKLCETWEVRWTSFSSMDGRSIRDHHWRGRSLRLLPRKFVPAVMS